MKHSIRWLTNSAFEIKYKNQTITTDPSVRFMTYQGLDEHSFSKPDYILLSHLHWDHISELRNMYAMYQPKILSGTLGRKELVNYLNANQVDVLPAYPGLSMDFGSFRVEVLYGIHRNNKKTIREQLKDVEAKCRLIDKDILGLQEIGSLEMLNYLITFDDGFRILFWGGEFSVMQESLLRDLSPDVALMQYSNSRKTEFLNMVDAVNPKAFIAFHHDFSCPKAKWLPMLEKCRSECRQNLIILDNQETITF